MEHTPAITLSRTLGSGGTEIGLRVARQLGWRFCDRRILRKAAEALQLPLATLRPQEERRVGFLEQLLRLTAFASPEVPFAPILELPLYSQELFEVERRIMAELLAQGPALLVGRGGCFAFRGRPATLHVRIQASLEFRVQHLLERGKAANEEAARQAILASDQNRTDFFRAFADLPWADPRNFDLVLDPSTSGLEACVKRIAAEAEMRFR